MDMQLPPVALTLTILRLTVVQTLLIDLNGADHNALLVRVLVTTTKRKESKCWLFTGPKKDSDKRENDSHLLLQQSGKYSQKMLAV